tara:strand:+ start:1704 stop:2120 length:417 start_codon:yes stop_codon:yes gene_type:complete
MIKELINLANHLDSKGLRKEADYIDGVITKVHGKGPDEPVDLELGDFSNLGKTNIDHDEAFSAGCSVCGNKEKSCGHHGGSYMIKPQLYKIYEYAKKLHDMIEDGESLPDWSESHIAKMDQMIESVYHSYDYKSKESL